MKKYIQTINDEIIKIGQEHTRLQNQVLKKFGLNEEQYEDVCFENPQIFDMFIRVQNSFKKDMKVLSEKDIKKVLEIQVKYLENK